MLTNNFPYVMFAAMIRLKRLKTGGKEWIETRKDQPHEQIKKVLTSVDQKLILMVRG